MMREGESKFNVESVSTIDEFVTDVTFQFEGGPFEEDKSWFLEQDEG